MPSAAGDAFVDDEIFWVKFVSLWAAAAGCG
jgi:hypothetical protein